MDLNNRQIQKNAPMPNTSTQSMQQLPRQNIQTDTMLNQIKNDQITQNNTSQNVLNNSKQNNNTSTNTANDKKISTLNISELDFNATKKARIYLKQLINMGGSDLHIKSNSHVRARINGDLFIMGNEIFSKEDALALAKELTRTRFPEFVANKEVDITYTYDITTRFRINIYFQMEGVSFAFRRIPTMHGSIKDLRLPESLSKIVNMERGLVLVTGITGSGKSTTLATLINEINVKHSKHIITIEDPIEFIHKDIKSMINQRSIGMDTNSFSSALKAALREDPDIILVGEMRDIETIEMAIHAAETGHLVLSTLHTIDAKETINRIISVFNPHEQARIRATLSSVLAAVLSQRLLKTIDGKRIPAVEILFKTPRIEAIIAESRDNEITEAIHEGKEIYKTQTFDQHLFDLVMDGIVDKEVALDKATSPSDLQLKLQNTDKNTFSSEEISIKVR